MPFSGEQIDLLCSLLAHNLTCTGIARTGRLTRPQGRLSLTLNANPSVQKRAPVLFSPGVIL
jgi:hypothetical protein